MSEQENTLYLNQRNTSEYKINFEKVNTLEDVKKLIKSLDVTSHIDEDVDTQWPMELLIKVENE